jgi:hypothetical protein
MLFAVPVTTREPGRFVAFPDWKMELAGSF